MAPIAMVHAPSEPKRDRWPLRVGVTPVMTEIQEDDR